MFEWIEQLQEKPEAVRRKLALLIAGGLTFVIVLIWLGVQAFASYAPAPSYYGEENPTVTSLKEDWKLIKDAAGKQQDIWEGVKGLFGGGN